MGSHRGLRVTTAVAALPKAIWRHREIVIQLSGSRTVTVSAGLPTVQDGGRIRARDHRAGKFDQKLVGPSRVSS